MISGVNTQLSNNYKNNVSFKAIPLGQYRPAQKNAIRIYQLEKSDLPFVSNFCENINNYFKKKNITNESTRTIMRDTFTSARNILSSDEKSLKDTKILVGVSDNEMHGILIGNIPKKDAKGKVHYSSRKNHSKNEREVDWFATWDSRGVGKSLVCEFFRSMKELTFSKLFVRSEVPEKSSAKEFYEHVGFKPIKNRDKIVKKTTNIDIVDKAEYIEPCDIIPMTVNRHTMVEKEKEISQRFQRRELLHKPIEIEYVVK